MMEVFPVAVSPRTRIFTTLSVGTDIFYEPLPSLENRCGGNGEVAFATVWRRCVYQKPFANRFLVCHDAIDFSHFRSWSMKYK